MRGRETLPSDQAEGLLESWSVPIPMFACRAMTLGANFGI